MASLRKAAAYSKKKVRPFTRKSKNRKKAYIKAVPPNKVVKYDMGNMKDSTAGKHKYRIKLISDEKIKVQVRDNALEACRTLLNKMLEKKIPGNYYFKIKCYPHHILRENKIAAGAGADRLSSGMRHSFGVIAGRAAIINPGQEILFVTCTDNKGSSVTKKAITMIKPKVPCKTRIVIERKE
jgi:large subunit ribosomal protein L10e